MRPAPVIPILLIVGFGLTGCTPPGLVCTTVGYGSQARITLAEPRPDVTLELCDGTGCEPGPSLSGPEDEATEGSITEYTGVYDLTGDSSTGWTGDLLPGQAEIGYRLLDTEGTAIAEGSVAVDWVRVGGTERCGGPHEAEIELPG